METLVFLVLRNPPSTKTSNLPNKQTAEKTLLSTPLYVFSNQPDHNNPWNFFKTKRSSLQFCRSCQYVRPNSKLFPLLRASGMQCLRKPTTRSQLQPPQPHNLQQPLPLSLTADYQQQNFLEAIGKAGILRFPLFSLLSGWRLRPFSPEPTHKPERMVIGWSALGVRETETKA